MCTYLERIVIFSTVTLTESTEKFSGTLRYQQYYHIEQQFTCLRQNFISAIYCGHTGVILTRLNTLRQRKMKQDIIYKVEFLAMDRRQWKAMIPEKVKQTIQAQIPCLRNILKYNIKRRGQHMTTELCMCMPKVQEAMQTALETCEANSLQVTSGQSETHLSSTP